jgi:hypothetical protein
MYDDGTVGRGEEPLISGIVADLLGLEFAIAVIAAITFLSGIVAAIFMYETIARKPHEQRQL